MKYKLNWRPSRRDIRDKVYVPEKPLLTLEPVVDMRNVYTKIFDQLDLGSCTANAAAGLVGFQRAQQGESGYKASRLFIYYEERVIEGSVRYDSGAQVRDAINVLYKQGACRELFWEYDISMFATQPTPDCYSNAENFKIKEYFYLDNTKLDEIKSCLSEGHAIIFGFTVYNSFYDANTSGFVPVPNRNDRVIGGHCVYIVGYDDTIQRFICVNSWGKNWGDNGIFYMPYEYISNPNLCSDFWTISLVD